MTKMIVDSCQRLRGYVWCSVVRDLIIERWQTIFCAVVVAIGILSGRLACGNGNEKTLVLQWTNKKSKARKNKLIVANQVLLKDNYVSNVIKQKVLRKYLKNAKMC
jgi:hypothetical protein